MTVKISISVKPRNFFPQKYFLIAEDKHFSYTIVYSQTICIQDFILPDM